IQHCSVVLGNSSSGIIEVPSFHIPTINIGIRQEGRLAAESVIHCHNDYPSIKLALHKALSEDFRKKCQEVANPYGDGMVSERIIKMIKQYKGSTIKYFQDMDVHHAY